MPRHPSKLSRPDLLAGGAALRQPLHGLSCFGSSAATQRQPQPNEEEIQMTESMYPPTTKALSERRRDLAPEIEAAFRQFSQAIFRDGALPGKTKQLIAVAVAHVTQCPYCIKGHTRAALRDGATPEELMEAIWVAAEMRAGAAYAHSVLALETIETSGPRRAAR
jgi:AhpD family alkylhydroperoxidase